MSENRFIFIKATSEEAEWVRHAARLRGLSLPEYIKRAINASLRSEGVDAVLFAERDPVVLAGREPSGAKR